MKNNIKKILYLVDYPLDLIGGAQKSTITTYKKMQEQGYDVYILAAKFIDNNNTGIPDEKIFIYEMKGTNKIKSIYKKSIVLLKTIRKNEIDIVHAQFPQYAVIMGILKKFKFINKRCKTIFTDRDYLESYNRKYKCIFKFIGSSFNTIICTTMANYNLWKKINNNVICIPNVLDEKWYKFDENIKKDIRNEYRIDENKINIGFAGRLCDYKRWDTVYEICKRLRDKSDILISIAISCEPTMEYKKRLNNYISSLKEILGEKLILFIDANELEMEKFYYLIDIFILTSEGESFGRTLIEAMSKKVVTIGTNSGGVPDVINKTENLFEVNDVDSAINLINKYYRNIDILCKDKIWFYNLVNNKFSIENFVCSMKDVYEKLI